MAETGSHSPQSAGDTSPDGLDYRLFVGRVLFPRSPNDLTDASQCPACFTVLAGKFCWVCQLDLSHPAAAEIATLSRQSAVLLDRRLESIGKIRYDTAQAHMVATAVTAKDARDVDAEASKGAAADPPPVLAPMSLPSMAPAVRVPGGGANAPIAPPPTLAPPPSSEIPPRRSSVQVLLLIVGISLLCVAAIFFLVYAFINFGILGRSLVIAAVTIASFVVASGLRRRSLATTAEGIAVLAVVLVYLDAFAIRANDFFSLAAANGFVFWGVALLVTAAGFLAWHRLSGLRTPHIIGFAAIVPGVALVVGGLTAAADDGSRLFFAFAAATLAGVAHRFTARPATAIRAAFAGRPERLIVGGFTGVALFGAFIAAATVAPGQPWASAPAFFVVAALAALHAVLADSVSGQSPTPSAAVFACIGGLAAAVAVASGALRLGDLNVIVIVPPVSAVLVTLALELLWRRLHRLEGAPAAPGRSMLVAMISAGTVAAITLLFPLGTAVGSVIVSVARSISSPWTLSANDELFRPTTLVGMAIAALLLCYLMIAAAWATGGTLRPRGAILCWLGALVLVVAVPLSTTLEAIMTGWLVLSAAALAAIYLSHRRWSHGRNRVAGLRLPLMVLLSVSGLLGYLVAWGSTATWWIGSLAAIALLLGSRLLPGSQLGRATALGASAVALIIGAAAAARQLGLPLDPNSAVDAENALRFISLVAVLLLAASAFRVTSGYSPLDRRVIFWIGGAAATASFGGLALSLGSLSPGERMSLLLPEAGTSLAADAALIAALLIVVTRPPASGQSASGQSASALPVDRIVASVALSPALSLVVDAFARVVGMPELVRSVGPISAALLAAVGVLVVANRHARTQTGLAPHSDPHARGGRKIGGPTMGGQGLGGERWPRELGVLLVAVPSVVIGVAREDTVTWLVLVIAALVVLVLATSPDGLVGSASPRRYLGWVALALATAGLWWRLGAAGVTDLEPYVLPLSGVLLIVALSVWRTTRVTTAPGADLVAPVITLTALLVAILPLAATAATGPLERAIVLGGVSAALLLLGSSFLGHSRTRPYLDAIALAGALGVLTVVFGRSTTLNAEPGTPDIRLDAWLVSGLIVLLIAAIGQARDRDDYSTARRSVRGELLGMLGLATFFAFELTAFDNTALGELRAFAVILLLCAVHVIAFLQGRAPVTRTVGWLAIVGAAVGAVGALITGAIGSVELGSIPVAAALILTGALTLSREPSARTWFWLAPGVSTLLIPSLIATAENPPLWRLVALGVVGVTIIVVSSFLRLQPPFLIATVVVLIHAAATFAPQIRAIYESVEWWLWFVPVGIAVVVFAARFEKSVLGMRSVAMRIRALR
ncbi:MAG: hypothetical protein H7279_12805 [Microbacteriaceae bacterium]|nr:hypothetical protein [Microbacteriaceae bacterium]